MAGVERSRSRNFHCTWELKNHESWILIINGQAQNPNKNELSTQNSLAHWLLSLIIEFKLMTQTQTKVFLSFHVYYWRLSNLPKKKVNERLWTLYAFFSYFSFFFYFQHYFFFSTFICVSNEKNEIKRK